MCTMMKGGILQAYSSVLRVTHGVLVTWISRKCSLKVSLKVRDRLLFVGRSLALMRVDVYKSTVGLAAAALLAEKQLGVSSLPEPSKVILTLLFYCTHGHMLAHDILQSVSFCTCRVGQDGFCLEIFVYLRRPRSMLLFVELNKRKIFANIPE